MNNQSQQEIYKPTIDDIDDFNKSKHCRFCKKKVAELFPNKCPYCKEPFESRADFFFRWAAYILVVLSGIYLWQKVLIGF